MKLVPANTNNYMVGRNGTKIDRVVLHWIVGTLESADATFQNPNRIASAHYGIGDSEIHQYVQEEDTAYANGNLEMNLRAISIEHEGGPDRPITDATYATSAKQVREICQRHGIPIDRQHILKHKEVSDTPTACPGTLDIDRIIREAQPPIDELDIPDLMRAAKVLKDQFEIKNPGGNYEGWANTLTQDAWPFYLKKDEIDKELISLHRNNQEAEEAYNHLAVDFDKALKEIESLKASKGSKTNDTFKPITALGKLFYEISRALG